MAPKKDNLPLTLDQDQDSTGTITYANEVVAVIAGVAANEVEGVAGMCAANGISEVFSRNTKNVTRGIKVELGTEEVSVDIYLMIEYGTPIQTAAQNVQENVRKAIETMTGLHVVKVDVHVTNVIFEKDEQTAALAAKLEKAVEEKPAPKAEKPADPDRDEDLDIDVEIEPEDEDEEEPEEAPEAESDEEKEE